jgi:WD40 repeat protein
VPHVFVSYVHEDVDLVMKLAEELREHGATLWLDRDELTVGDDWESEIRTAIRNGMFFMPCFSQNFMRLPRTFMSREVHLALEERTMRRPGRWFLPVVLNPIELSQLWADEWSPLSRVQHVKLYPDRQAGVEQLLDVIAPASGATRREARIRNVDPPHEVVREPAPVERADITTPRLASDVGEVDQQREVHQDERVESLEFHPGGQILASAAQDDDAVRLWSVPNLDELDVKFPHNGPVSALAFSPDGRWIATAGRDLFVRIWDVMTGEQIWSLRHPEDLGPHGRFRPKMAFNGRGTLLATAHITGRLRVWDLGSGEEVPGAPEVKHVWDLAFNPFDRILATADADGSGRLRDVDKWRVVLRKPSERRTFALSSDPMKQVCVSPDGHLLATVTKNGQCQVWQTRTGREVIELGRTGVTRVAFSRVRRLMAGVLRDRTIRVWEVDGGQEVISVSHPSSASRLAFRPDAAMLATVDDEGSARLISIDRPDEPKVLNHLALDVAFAPDCRSLATGGDAIVLWGPDL